MVIGRPGCLVADNPPQPVAGRSQLNCGRLYGWCDPRKGHIFLIARYRRTSGIDLTARIPSAAPAAVMVIAATYPSACMMFLLLLFSGPVIAAHYVDVPLSRTGQRPAPLLLTQYAARIYAPGNALGRPRGGAAVLPAGGKGANRARLTQSQHRELRTSRRHRLTNAIGHRGLERLLDINTMQVMATVTPQGPPR